MTKITHENMEDWFPRNESIVQSIGNWTGGTYLDQLVLALQHKGATVESITDQQVQDTITTLENVLDEV